ncbi:hypothetical protein [Rhodococcus sp. NPDC060176]|uniref:hypothetical protein n=1 Tax=Rhodococcus sp. NPDC060176 TaxID=3347062 RepID=UPI003656C9B2
MKKIFTGALVTAAAGAMLLGGTGAANAAVTISHPTVANQVCGNVFTGATIAQGPSHASATGVSNVVVKGTLYNSSGTPVWTDQTGPGGAVPNRFANTDSQGRWCITGDASLVPTITGGGYVVLETPYTASTNNPWKGGFPASTHIDQWVFLAHAVSVGGGALNSAEDFNFAT